MDEALGFTTSHWPFISVASGLWVIGHFMQTSVFTKEREKRYDLTVWAQTHGDGDKRSPGQKLHHWFFHWGRESMELHPLVAGVLIFVFWRNPENADPAWPLVGSMAYGLLAGVASLFGWKGLTWLLGRFGIELGDKPVFPGEDDNKPAGN